MKNNDFSKISNLMTNASFVAALLVVFIHVPSRTQMGGGGGWWLHQFFYAGIARCAVPYFFFASGFWLAKSTDCHHWWRMALFKRLRTLVVPYFVWSIIHSIYLNVVLIAGNLYHSRFILESVLTGTDRLRWVGLTFDPYLVPFWFLQALLALVILAPLLIGKICYLSLVVSVVSFVGWIFNAPFVSVFHLSYWAIFFFSFGGLIYYTGMLSVICNHKKCSIFIGCFSCFILCVLAYLRGVESMAGEVSVNPAAYMDFYMKIIACCGLITLICLVPTATTKSWMREYSFPIYILHPFVIPFVGFVFDRDDLTASEVSFSWIMLVVGTLFVTWMLLRFLPRFTSVAFGNRITKG